jgi:hypothetical protein
MGRPLYFPAAFARLGDTFALLFQHDLAFPEMRAS